MTQRFALGLATVLTVFMLAVMGGLVSQLSQSTSVASAPAVPAPVVLPTVAQAAALDPALKEQLTQRESDYQKLLQQANAELQQANAELQRTNAQLQQVQAEQDRAKEQAQAEAQAKAQAEAQAKAQAQALALAQQKAQQLAQQQAQAKAQAEAQAQAKAQAEAQAQAAAQPQYAVTPDKAAAIALKAATGAKLLRDAELVSFQGAVAYEVTLDRGLVYVDANSGQILFDGTVVAQANSDSDGGGQHGGPPSGQHDHEKGDDHGGHDDHTGGGD